MNPTHLNLGRHNAFFHPRKYPEIIQIWSDGKVKPYFFGTYSSSIIIQQYTLAQNIITTLSKDASFLELSQTTASALHTLGTHPQPWTPYQIFEGFFRMGILVPAESPKCSCPELKQLTLL